MTAVPPLGGPAQVTNHDALLDVETKKTVFRWKLMQATFIKTAQSSCMQVLHVIIPMSTLTAATWPTTCMLAQAASAATMAVAAMNQGIWA
jgi:hypothetical protein